MSRELTPDEKGLVEREFVAREAAAAKRRSLIWAVFLVGISGGVASGLLRGFEVRGVAQLLLHITWLVCLVAYVGGQILPASFGKDMDPRWHLNPWQDALGSLSPGRRLAEAIALLAGPHLVYMASSFAYLSLK